jgi:hypothetical protein
LFANKNDSDAINDLNFKNILIDEVWGSDFAINYEKLLAMVSSEEMLTRGFAATDPAAKDDRTQKIILMNQINADISTFIVKHDYPPSWRIQFKIDDTGEFSQAVQDKGQTLYKGWKNNDSVWIAPDGTKVLTSADVTVGACSSTRILFPTSIIISEI